MFSMVPYRRYLAKPSNPFSTMMNDPFLRAFFNQNESFATSTFRVDVKENNDAFLIEAELPGLKEDAITLEVKENMLTIKADYQEETQEENTGRVYTERRSGSMERTFNLDQVDADNITANYKNGILYVNLPKLKPIENSVRRIPITTEEVSSQEV